MTNISLSVSVSLAGPDRFRITASAALHSSPLEALDPLRLKVGSAPRSQLPCLRPLI